MANKYPQYSKVTDPEEALILLLAFEIPFGSLWWVDEILWLRYLPHYISENRKQHPGLCCNPPSVQPPAYFMPVSMMLGTSKKKGRSFFVPNLTPDQKGTHFSPRKVAGIPAEMFADRLQIRRNVSKPGLTDDQKQALKTFSNA